MVIQGVRCVGCNNWYGERNTEHITIDEQVFHVCPGCCENLDGPGKHEGIHETDQALCVVLESILGQSGEDHRLSDEWNGFLGVIDRYVYLEDSRGFVDIRTYPDKERAMAYADEMERDGFGANESDAYITSVYNGYEVSFDGRHLTTYHSLRRAKAAVSLQMRKTGYYPAVFLCDERGSMRMIEVW